MTIRDVLENNRALCLDDDEDLEELHDALLEEVVRLAEEADPERWYMNDMDGEMFWFFWSLINDERPFNAEIKAKVKAAQEKL